MRLITDLSKLQLKMWEWLELINLLKYSKCSDWSIQINPPLSDNWSLMKSAMDVTLSLRQLDGV